MAYTNRASFATIRSATAAAIGAGYTTLGVSLTEPAVILSFLNNTNGDVFVSTDGTTDHLILPAATYQIFDIRTNAPNLSNLLFRAGTQFSVKDGPTVATSGTFYLQVVEVVNQ